MNYEKAYKEALERAKSFELPEYKNIMVSIFPELHETEDEKIRKELMDFIYVTCVPVKDLKKKERFLAWLEKQDKESSWKPSKEEMDVLYGLAYITNQYDEHKEEIITRLYQDLKREFFNCSSYENMFPTNTSMEEDVRRRSTIQVLEYARSLDTYNQYGKADIDKNIAWLEKQGESDETKAKTFLINKGYPIDANGTLPTYEELYNIIIEGLEHQGEKPINNTDEEIVEAVRDVSVLDMVEPKFHEGDWVVYMNDICQIVKREEGCNKLVTVFGIEKELVNERNLSTARHWTIQDAKDGDVLACPLPKGYENGEQIFIFKEINDRDYVKNAVEYYCRVVDNDFYVNERGFMGQSDDYFVPATKSQRDTLFAKMKEAGYEWNAEKKELREIENEIEIPFGAKDSELYEVTYFIPQGFHAEIEDDKVVIKKGKKSTEWSEEDERMFGSVVWHLRDSVNNGEKRHSAGQLEDWLKSLKDRHTWKPSEEQMKALYSAINDAISLYSDKLSPLYEEISRKHFDILESLYNDLKKL